MAMKNENNMAAAKAALSKEGIENSGKMASCGEMKISRNHENQWQWQLAA
jgi:hypothetical protein